GGGRRRRRGLLPVMQDLGALDHEQPGEEHSPDREDDDLLTPLGGDRGGVDFLGHYGFAPAAVVPLGAVWVESDGGVATTPTKLNASIVSVAFTSGKDCLLLSGRPSSIESTENSRPVALSWCFLTSTSFVTSPRNAETSLNRPCSVTAAGWT